MAKTISLERAARAWCTPKTEGVVMDPILAEAFADVLDEVQAERIDKETGGLK